MRRCVMGVDFSEDDALVQAAVGLAITHMHKGTSLEQASAEVVAMESKELRPGRGGAGARDRRAGGG